ncbi:hypothetical protein GGI35DRAFT_250919 [Trichoderma velutinum]
MLATLLSNGYNAGSLNRVYRKRLDECKAGAPEGPSKVPPAGESSLYKLVECIERADCSPSVNPRAAFNIRRTDGSGLNQTISHVVA